MAFWAGPLPPARNCFNGAMAVRPWMGQCRHSLSVMSGALQWGHGREAMDGGCLTDVERLALALQWGHGREAMDGRDGRINTFLFKGKLQWGHGREAMDGSKHAFSSMAAAGFNGAMAVRPWMGPGPWRPQRRTSRFNGAMAVRPWMAWRAG